MGAIPADHEGSARRDRAGGGHRDPAAAAQALGQALRKHLRELKKLKPDQLIAQRYDKFRAMGVFSGK